MKRLLLPILAAVVLPTAVKADNDFNSIVDKLDNTDFNDRSHSFLFYAIKKRFIHNIEPLFGLNLHKVQ
mgnify:CR=1 FL=1